MTVAIVIPAFNEAGSIGQVVVGVKSLGHVIVVDDASSDATADVAESVGAHVVRHETNKGYSGALNSGFRTARDLSADVCVTFDADGQHRAEDLRSILDLMGRDDVALVIGARPSQARISERVFSAYARQRYGIPDILCGLKAYRMDLFDARGYFDMIDSIGTELALSSIAHGARWTSFPIAVEIRADQPRMGNALRANWLIFRALFRVIRADLGGWRQ
ncbi:MAG: glycosyltransferase family 2 protein [Alphaproteobacteria bacterium]